MPGRGNNGPYEKQDGESYDWELCLSPCGVEIIAIYHWHKRGVIEVDTIALTNHWTNPDV